MRLKPFTTTIMLIFILTISLSGQTKAYIPPSDPEDGFNLSPEPANSERGIYQWTSLGGPEVSGGTASSVVVDLANPGTIYAAISPSANGGSNIYRSTDSGSSWTLIYETVTYASAMGAYDDQLIVVHQQWGHPAPVIFASLDGGSTWLPPFSLEFGGGFNSVSIDSANPQIAILGGSGYTNTYENRGLVYGTSDGGLTWNTLLDVPETCQQALISPHNSNLMLAGCQAHIYRSEDGGSHWSDVKILDDNNITALIAHPTDALTFFTSTCYTGAPCQVYRSEDGGLTWVSVYAESGGYLVYMPPSTIYLADHTLLWKSNQNGDPDTWEIFSDLPDVSLAFSIDTGTAPNTLYVGLRRDGIVNSTDGGITWQAKNNDITSVPTIVDIDVIPGSPDKIFAATGAHYYYGDNVTFGGFRSSDGGSSWIRVNNADILTFAIDPNNSSLVLAGASACESPTIYRSEDGGANLTGVYTPPWFLSNCEGGSQTIYSMAVSDSHPDTIYAVGQSTSPEGTKTGVVLLSVDGGIIWDEVHTLPDTAFTGLAVDPLNNQIAYARGGGVIYRTQDEGHTWQLVFSNVNPVVGMVVDPVDPNIIYTCLSWQQGILYKSTDGGDTWNMIETNTPDWPGGYNCLAIDPMDHNHLYILSMDYIGESLDAGTTWSSFNDPINQGVPAGWQPMVLVPDNRYPMQTLYAGMSGVWSYQRLAVVSGDRYVTKSGTDTWNNCVDPTAPCLTVGYALDIANPGETIYVAEGTYLENIAIDKSITIKGGYSGPPDWTYDLVEHETVLDGSSNPTVPGVWDGASVGLPSVIWDSDAGLYRMYYNGSGGISNWAIGLATSPDGITWARYAGNPVLVGDPSTWEGDMVEEPFVRLESGTYKMWYGNYHDIGYATSSDGIHWVKYPTPVFEPNPNPLTWDSNDVRSPSIVKPGSEYVMAYNGNGDYGWKVGIATSSDGIHWTRHGAPVLEGSGEPGAWDERGAYRADLAYAGGVYHLLYTSSNWSMGVATSSDAINWTRYAGNPILPGNDPWEYNRTWGATHLNIGGVWRTWYAASSEFGWLRIGLATSSDGFSWTMDSAHNPVLEPGTPGDIQGEPVVLISSENEVSVYLEGLTITQGTYFNGGGISLETGYLALQSVKVIDNMAFFLGGGVYIAEGLGAHLDVVNSEILNNQALGLGGGIYNAGDLNLTRSTLSGNQAPHGGGISNEFSGNANVLNCTFYNNTSSVIGGGINNNNGASIKLVNLTLLGNSAPLAGGIAIEDGTARGWNLLLAGNTGGECSGTWAAGSNNLATDSSCGDSFSQVMLEIIKLGPLSGHPAYYPLQYGSVAIDGGTTAWCLENDEPGNLRPLDGNGDGVSVCDVGAYEAPALIFSTHSYLPLIMH